MNNKTYKKKNTYIINPYNINNYDSMHNITIPVVKINGKPVTDTTMQFPKTGIMNLLNGHEHLKTVMGEELSCTIVEYLDKNTSEPILLLFPTNDIMGIFKSEEILSKLNHASRQDLKYQMSRREKYLNLLRHKTHEQQK